MGVISLQGTGQAELVEKLSSSVPISRNYRGRKLICGNPYAFQGDERDVVFLSMVAAPNAKIGTLSKDQLSYIQRFKRGREQSQGSRFSFSQCPD